MLLEQVDLVSKSDRRSELLRPQFNTLANEYVRGVLEVQDLKEDYPNSYTAYRKRLTELRRNSKERNDAWLFDKLYFIINTYFPDFVEDPSVIIAYGSFWKRKLGDIRLNLLGDTSMIRINKFLSLKKVDDFELPECLTTITIAHELIHYVHGFGSNNRRDQADPHVDSNGNNYVERELATRGLRWEKEEYDEWITDNWYPHYYVAK